MRKNLIMSLLMAIILAFVAIFVPVKTVRADGNVCRNVRVNDADPSKGLYASLSSAFNALVLQNGDTIEMLDNHTNTGSSGISVEKQVTLDLNGHNLTFTSSTGGFVFGPGNDYDLIHSTLTIRATNGGSIIKSSGDLVRFTHPGSEGVIYNHLTIQSGRFECFNLYTDKPSSITRLRDESAIFEDLVTINGGTFTCMYATIRTHLKELIDDEAYLLSSTDAAVDPKYKLEVKPNSYVTNEDTKASAKVSYTEGYSCYRRVTSLSSSDAGKKYLIAYVNKSEDAIYIMKNYANASYHLMYPDKHNNVNKTNDGTWYINSNSEFVGAPDEDFFVTLGWASNGYTLSVKAGATNKYLFYNKGNQFEPLADSYTENDNYIYKFGFNDPEDYLYPLSYSTNIVYTPKGTYAGYFRLAGTGITSETGLGDADNVRAHLFEKVDIDPVVSDASLRFGQTISKDMYDYLSGCGTTVTFGVIAKLTSALGGDELEYANAQIKKTITPVRVSSAGATEEDLEGDYYQFALVLSGLTCTDYETSVTARCFVCIDGHYYYFNPSVYSLKTLANAYYNAVDTSAYTDHLPVLGYLKDYGD